uniref:Putative secreted protein n=1 Tax=Anopheles darlingi TaxID=43151 RepID=A0A2M4DHJ2_ANODA
MPLDSTLSAAVFAFSFFATSDNLTRARSVEPSVFAFFPSTDSSSAYCTVNSKSSVCLLNVMTFFCG